MPNGKIADDLRRISAQRMSTTPNGRVMIDSERIVNALLEVSYQIAMLRGDVADLIEEDRKS